MTNTRTWIQSVPEHSPSVDGLARVKMSKSSLLTNRSDFFTSNSYCVDTDDDKSKYFVKHVFYFIVDDQYLLIMYSPIVTTTLYDLHPTLCDKTPRFVHMTNVSPYVTNVGPYLGDSPSAGRLCIIRRRILGIPGHQKREGIIFLLVVMVPFPLKVSDRDALEKK